MKQHWNSTWRVCQTSFFIAMYDDFEHRLKSVSTPFTTHFPAGKTSHWATLDSQGNILFGGVKGFKWSIFHLYFVKLHQVGHLPLLVWTSTPPFQRVTWWCHLRRNARRAASRLTVKTHGENLRKKTQQEQCPNIHGTSNIWSYESYDTSGTKKKHESMDCWWILGFMSFLHLLTKFNPSFWTLHLFFSWVPEQMRIRSSPLLKHSTTCISKKQQIGAILMAQKFKYNTLSCTTSRYRIGKYKISNFDLTPNVGD